MSNEFAQYHQAVRYLDSLSNLRPPDYPSHGSRSLFLRRFEYFLNLIGNPHRGLRYIHVGGTSGKGSVATMIHSILTAAGQTAGLYLSPHPTAAIERFKVGNYFISPQEFAELVNQLKPAIDRTDRRSPYGTPSHFELLTAMAFLYFQQKKCRYAVLEVGLGGRYDATNVIDRADVTVINRIGHDHTDILGLTLPEIAREKAAIIKPKTVFFTTAKNPKNIVTIFQKTCQKKQVPCRVVSLPPTPYPLQLLGKHQQYNAEIAAQACQTLGVKQADIIKGLRAAQLACRLEIIARKPLVILDGAHNFSKMETVVDAIKNLTYRKLYLIIALTKSRNPVTVFKKIIPLADHIIITRYQSSERRCYPPQEMARVIKPKKPFETFLDANMAMDRALTLASLQDLIVVTGSFFLAGELRQRWRPESALLKERKI